MQKCFDASCFEGLDTFSLIRCEVGFNKVPCFGVICLLVHLTRYLKTVGVQGK